MSSLMYQKDRSPVMVTDDKGSRDVMRKQGWSDKPIEEKKIVIKKAK